MQREEFAAYVARLQRENPNQRVVVYTTIVVDGYRIKVAMTAA